MSVLISQWKTLKQFQIKKIKVVFRYFNVILEALTEMLIN